jgi:hypothetical protein
MQVPVFLTLFLAPVYVPLELLGGWVHTAAQLNPLTAVLAGLGTLCIVWALRSAERAAAS